MEREEFQRGRAGSVQDFEPVKDEELWTGEEDGDHAGWFCVRTDRDDANLLRHAQRAMEVGRNPRVVSYERDYGPSASYYAWEAAGRPVHGIRK